MDSTMVENNQSYFGNNEQGYVYNPFLSYADNMHSYVSQSRIKRRSFQESLSNDDNETLEYKGQTNTKRRIKISTDDRTNKRFDAIYQRLNNKGKENIGNNQNSQNNMAVISQNPSQSSQIIGQSQSRPFRNNFSSSTTTSINNIFNPMMNNQNNRVNSTTNFPFNPVNHMNQMNNTNTSVFSFPNRSNSFGLFKNTSSTSKNSTAFEKCANFNSNLYQIPSGLKYYAQIQKERLQNQMDISDDKSNANIDMEEEQKNVECFYQNRNAQLNNAMFGNEQSFY